MTQVFFFYTGALGSFPDPGNWTPANNTIECIGSGAQGAASQYFGEASGGGGGAGAYAKLVNYASFTFPISYMVTAANQVGGTGFNVSSMADPGAVAGVCWAQDGSVPPGAGSQSPGAGGSVWRGTSGNVGGSGGKGYYGAGWGGGGGGAGGPNGPGGTGAAAISGSSVVGGTADGGTVPGGAINGGVGNTGTQFDATHGCGSGGGSANSGIKAGNGGLYGGGGGGSWTNGGGLAGGLGANGIICITYTAPAAPPPSSARVLFIG